MTTQEALNIAGKLMGIAGLEIPPALQPKDFREYAMLVADIVRSHLTPRQRANMPYLKEWADVWKQMYDEYEAMLRWDPMQFYRPQHKISKRFHESMAFIRYYMAGNGTSKTTTANADIWSCVTGQQLGGTAHLLYPRPPSAVGMVSVGFTTYKSSTFLPKFLLGENGNILSPMFPEDGKWFHSFDKKENKIWIACPQCAEEKKAKSCWHTKSSIKLFSDEGGWEGFQSASFRLVELDEHVDEGFFLEAQQRVSRVPGGRIMITGTPLFGPEAWEIKRLLKVYEGDPALNRQEDKEDAALKVEVFKVNQYEAGILSHSQIDMLKQGMDEYEIKARVYGEPMPRAKNPVFNRQRLSDLSKGCTTPTYGHLTSAIFEAENRPFTLEELAQSSDLTFTQVESPHEPQMFTGLRVWEPPQEDCQYIIPADSAAGLSAVTHDASCAQVLKLEDKGDGFIHMEQVAQFYGWLNPIEYGDELKKLGYWYNTALIIPEYTGIGRALLLRLSKQLLYPNLFQDARQPEYATEMDSPQYGVDTNQATKPLMVASLQEALNKGRLILKDEPTIRELLAFQQERSGQMVQTRYRGADGSRDDRVMALAFGTYAALSQAEVFAFVQEGLRRTQESKKPPKPAYQSESPFQVI